MRRVLLESERLPEIFRPEAIQMAAATASQYWNVAWPMMNLALWLGMLENPDGRDTERLIGRLSDGLGPT
jgi:hypothetical protein